MSKKLRRYRVPLTVAAGVLLLLTGVTMYARILRERDAAVAARIENESQRQEAERQRDKAVRERAEADRRRSESEKHRREAESQRQLALKTLGELKETAPTFYARSRALVNDRNFAEALKNASFAADLVPDDPAYQLARANILESLYRFDEAAAAYDVVLGLRSDDAIATENRALCRRLAMEQKEKGELSLATLSKWQSNMQRQKRFGEAMELLARVNEKGRSRKQQIDRYVKLLEAGGVRSVLHYGKNDLLEFTYSDRDADRRDWSILKGIPIERAKFEGSKINDLAPLAGMPLKSLYLDGTSISDLRPLAGMSLVEVNLSNTKASDLSPLSGMPLTILDLSGARVSDLTPLHGAPLIDLVLNGTAVKDLTPLHGMPLRRLCLLNCGSVDDIAPLQGMPLEELDLGGTKVWDLIALRGTKLRILKFRNGVVSDISALAGMPLTTLDIHSTNVTDILPLRGSPIRALGITHQSELRLADALPELRELHQIDIAGADAGDVEALRTSTVTDVRLSGSFTDLSPLHGKPLESLALGGSRNLSDLAPLEGMPLKRLSLDNCVSLRDLRPLLKCPQLEWLSIPSQCPDIELLRQMSSLKYIAFDRGIDYLGPGNCPTAEEFWKAYDARRAPGK